MRPLTVAFGSLLFLGSTAPAPTVGPKGDPEPRVAVLTGTVKEDSTGRPLPGVEVVLEEARRQTTTDASGNYLLAGLAAGNHVVLFRRVGYRPIRQRVNLVDRDTVRADATMMREGVQQLDPVEVTATPKAPRGIGIEAFEERRKLGFGKFIDSTELRRSEHRRVSDVLRAIPGVNIVRYRECEGRKCGPTEERAASGRGQTSMFGGGRGGDYCWMSVVVDGAVLYNSGGSIPPTDWSRDFRVSELAAIEVYRSSAEAPTEYAGTAGACGVIIAWTRRA